MKQFFRYLSVALLALAGSTAFAQKTFVPETVSDEPPDPEIERKSFKVTDGFEVNLFAADPLLAKPIQMNWDAQGRLWIASSSMYPQIKPGEAPRDRIIVLQDTNNDGKADKSTVFADGLLIPTAVAPGDGGAYVANSTELIHLKDTDNDGKADERRIVLSGFGTEDTHHILHTFRWGNDGRLWMNQSIYIHSHVETPWGTKRLMGSGIWRFRPESQEFDVFARGMVNPWGHAFDRFGQSFSTDGAGGEGIYYTFPGSAFQTAKAWDGITDMPRIMKGMNPGSPKYCSLEIVTGRHLPDDWQGNLITNDFRANRVVRYQLIDQNGTFVSKQLPDVITSKDVAFRPIDVKMGPDGAIYIADWFNPIINHGEVDFRDKRRDHVHGRIWRLTAKGRPLVKPPHLVGASVKDLLDQLKSPEEWTRHQAKLVMRSLGAKEVIPQLESWTNALADNEPDAEHHALEALWTYQTLDTPNATLLTKLLNTRTPQVRAAAVRVVPDWASRLPDAMALLAARIADEHPRVRLEAIRALARLGTPAAFELAMTALDHPMDPQIDFALWTTANEMKAIWLPAFQSEKLRLSNNPRHISYALGAVRAPEAIGVLVKQLQAGQIPATDQDEVFELIASIGNASHAKAMFDLATAPGADADTASHALAAIGRMLRERKVAPSDASAETLLPFIVSDGPVSRRNAAIQLAGIWQCKSTTDALEQLASAKETTEGIRNAAIFALGEHGAAEADFLKRLDDPSRPFSVRSMAISALASIDLKDSARRSATLLASAPANADPSMLVTTLLQREGGGDALAAALEPKQLNSDVAKVAIRYVNSSGREAPALTAYLRAAAGIGVSTPVLTAEQMASLIVEVQEHGNAQRGELVFRRADMGCFQCHAIGGAGSTLAPDLRAIGASSPIDYLIDSILNPAKAVKDGYESTAIATRSGEVFSGIKVSQDDKQIVIRDALHDSIAIPISNIRRQKAGGSLMPVGLADTLTHQEFLDLIRFLSDLGKPGPYAPDTALLIRRWRVPDPKAKPEAWVPAYSMVSGTLPADAMIAGEAKAEIDVTTPGRIGLSFAEVKGLSLSIDSKTVELKSDLEVELPKGIHELAFKIDSSVRADHGIRVEVRDLPGSTGHAQPVGGR